METVEKVWMTKSQGGLGFRDMECFNQAMLSKKYCRLLTNPNSLVAKIMQEKYYKQGDLLQARTGNAPS